MIPPQYAPDESEVVRFSERTWLQGAFLSVLAYGMQVILYSMSFYWLYYPKDHHGPNSKRHIGLMIYITIIFLLSTLYIVGLLLFTQYAFIDYRNFPGGPSVFETIMFSIPIDMLPNVLMVLLSWMCDIINIWRCIVVYTGSSIPVWVVCAIPALLYMGSMALGICFLKQVGATSQSPWASGGINFTIPYYSMSLALNILVTALIVVRPLIYRNRISKALGKSHGAHYTSIVAMIVESAVIHSSFSLLFLVPFSLNHPLSQIFIQSLSPVQNVSTFLIIFRVAQGKGWTPDTFSNIIIIASGGSNRTPLAFQVSKNNHSGIRHEREAISLPKPNLFSSPNVRHGHGEGV